MRSTILLSGGIDSAGCLAFAIGRDEATTALHVQYGQAAAASELHAVQLICAHFDVALDVVNLGTPYETTRGYMPGRNALLVSAALTKNPDGGLLYVGFHRDTVYPDCSAAFVESAQRMVDIYCAGGIQLVAPFLTMSKVAVVAFCMEKGVPLGLTYSCEAGTEPPCGACTSCLDPIPIR